eukprot:GEMP01004846.1.p1 GENE.GEMP01004846.1~~GEMP01004846.1.p1  ORF type:complete len:1283 (+),score=408.97 GEMP01004846.1:129-3977(+)
MTNLLAAAQLLENLDRHDADTKTALKYLQPVLSRHPNNIQAKALKAYALSNANPKEAAQLALDVFAARPMCAISIKFLLRYYAASSLLNEPILFLRRCPAECEEIDVQLFLALARRDAFHSGGVGAMGARSQRPKMTSTEGGTIRPEGGGAAQSTNPYPNPNPSAPTLSTQAPHSKGEGGNAMLHAVRVVPLEIGLETQQCAMKLYKLYPKEDRYLRWVIAILLLFHSRDPTPPAAMVDPEDLTEHGSVDVVCRSLDLADVLAQHVKLVPFLLLARGGTRPIGAEKHCAAASHSELQVGPDEAGDGFSTVEKENPWQSLALGPDLYDGRRRNAYALLLLLAVHVRRGMVDDACGLLETHESLLFLPHDASTLKCRLYEDKDAWDQSQAFVFNAEQEGSDVDWSRIQECVYLSFFCSSVDTKTGSSATFADDDDVNDDDPDPRSNASDKQELEHDFRSRVHMEDDAWFGDVVDLDDLNDAAAHPTDDNDDNVRQCYFLMKYLQAHGQLMTDHLGGGAGGGLLSEARLEANGAEERQRGGYLGELELRLVSFAMSEIQVSSRAKQSTSRADVQDFIEVIRVYYEQFGHLYVCALDLQRYIAILDFSKRALLLQKLQKSYEQFMDDHASDSARMAVARSGVMLPDGVSQENIVNEEIASAQRYHTLQRIRLFAVPQTDSSDLRQWIVELLSQDTGRPSTLPLSLDAVRLLITLYHRTAHSAPDPSLLLDALTVCDLCWRRSVTEKNKDGPASSGLSPQPGNGPQQSGSPHTNVKNGSMEVRILLLTLYALLGSRSGFAKGMVVPLVDMLLTEEAKEFYSTVKEYYMEYEAALLYCAEDTWRYGAYHRIPEIHRSIHQNKTSATRALATVEQIWMDLFYTKARSSAFTYTRELCGRIFDAIPTLQPLVHAVFTDERALESTSFPAQRTPNTHKSPGATPQWAAPLTFPTSPIEAAQQYVQQYVDAPLTSVSSCWPMGAIGMTKLLTHDVSVEQRQATLPALPRPCDPGWDCPVERTIRLKSLAMLMLYNVFCSNADALSRQIAELADFLVQFGICGHMDVWLLRGTGKANTLESPEADLGSVDSRMDEVVIGKAAALGGFPPLAALSSGEWPSGIFTDLAWRAVQLAFEVSYLILVGDDVARVLVALYIAWEELLTWAQKFTTGAPCFALWRDVVLVLDLIVPLLASWPQMMPSIASTHKTYWRLRESLLRAEKAAMESSAAPNVTDAGYGTLTEWQLALREAVFSADFDKRRTVLGSQLAQCYKKSRQLIEKTVTEKVAVLLQES